MIEMILTSSVLILIILMLRRFAGGNISMRLRYALWFLAAVRLMVPVNVGSSSVSVLNLLPDAAQYGEESILADRISGMKNEDGSANGIVSAKPEFGEQLKAAEQESLREQSTAAAAQDSAYGIKGSAEENENEGISGQDSMLLERGLEDSGNDTANLTKRGRIWSLSHTGRTLLTVIWVAGIVLVGGYIALTQFRFVRYLHKNREAVSMKAVAKEWEDRLTEHGMKIYQIQGLPSPCLVGRNIYISRKLCKETDILTHILAHEYCHARQHDTLWAILRSALTAVYWFHPLVWVAAYGAKQDSELACDEAAVELLGENNRYEYGRTLLYLLNNGSNRIGYAGMILTMDGKKSGIRERVSMIAGKHSGKKWAAAAVGVIMCISCGCAFTGAKDTEQPGKNLAAEEAGSQMQTEESALKEEEMRRLAEENAILEKENAQLEEALEEMKKQLSETKQMEMTETSAEEQRLAQLKTRAENDKAFQRMLWETDVHTIMQNKEIDSQAYCKYYLGDTQDCPLENGTWYILQNDSGIALYGLYTEKYGCYGLATLIDQDMNFFMEEWLPGIRMGNIEVIEQAENGQPRTFAFTIRKAETGISEIWKLYVADRYDTGHVELYSFSEFEYWKQFENMMNFSVQQDSGRIMVTCEGDTAVGEIDVSAFEDYVIEDVVWNGDPVGFQFENRIEEESSHTGGSKESGNAGVQVTMYTGIGLKLQGRDEVWYNGLAPLAFPVNIGEWGEHKMMLGIPTVESSWEINKPQTALPDVEEKMGITPIHLTESED